MGCFVIYDRSNFMGNQMFLKRGEYSDFQRMGSVMGMGDMTMLESIRSCRMIPMVRRPQLEFHRLLVFDDDMIIFMMLFMLFLFI